MNKSNFSKLFVTRLVPKTDNAEEGMKEFAAEMKNAIRMKIDGSFDTFEFSLNDLLLIQWIHRIMTRSKGSIGTRNSLYLTNTYYP